MAAIDKLYVNSFFDFDELRMWCLIHKPKMLANMYHVFDTTYESWQESKELAYENHKTIIENFFQHYPKLEDFLKDCNPEYIESQTSDYQYQVELKNKLEELNYKEKFIDEYEFPVANFTFKQDKYLLWRCPLPFVREYLEKNCGYKTKWYHKLFFKEI